VFCSKFNNPTDPKEQEAIKKRHQERLAKRKKEDEHKEKIRKEQAERDRVRFNKSSETGVSPYLELKQVKAHGVRFEGNILLVPMIDSNGQIQCLQEIHPKKKLFFNETKPRDKHFTNAMKGLYHSIGEIKDGEPIRVSEGYATADTVFNCTGQTIPHIVAFSAGNYQHVIPFLKELYPNSPIIICADNNLHEDKTAKNVGLDEAYKVAEKHNCSVVFPTFPEGKQYDNDDFNDLMIIAGAQEVKQQIENIEHKPEDLEEKENSQVSDILEYLSKNEIGDAELFVKLSKEKYLFDPTEGKEGVFYLWDGRSWSIDLHKERYKDFECVAKAYLNAKNTVVFEENIQEVVEKRVNQLRTSRRRKSVFDTVSAFISFKDKWDYMPFKLPCANGVIDLKTGELTKSNPKQFIKKVCSVNYNPNAKCPNFEKFLTEITLGRDELKSFLPRLFGYAILGVPREEKVFYFFGKGRNGKGTLIQTIQSVLGSFARTFPSEMLLIQRNPPSSSSPNPEKANLEGVRMAIFSEINEGRKIDSAEVKNLSGRDVISCRRLFSNIDLQIIPTHTMILQTNYKPKAPSEDIALWSRNFLVPFDADFTKTANENLKEELLKESEGILKWIVDGCLEYQKEGLKIPKIILDQTEDYRQENDGIGRFLSEMCVKGDEFTTPCQEMLNAIKDYCNEEGLNIPSRNEITDYLKVKFKKNETSRGNFWKGVSIKVSNSYEY
jgi:putative DNA primase/helicase